MVIDANVWVAASDPHDPLQQVAIAFFAAAALSGTELRGPSTTVVEVACALARKAGDPEVGVRAYHELMDHAELALERMDAPLLDAAVQIGAGLGLRSGDALYAAVAKLHAMPLVSWDRDLVDRAGAVTPEQWLAGQGAGSSEQ